MKRNKIFNQRLVFYLCAVAWPVVQFIVFYLFVNANSIALSFRAMNTAKFAETGSVWEFVGLDNFRQVLRDFANEPLMKDALKNTFIIFGISLVTMFTPIVLAYYLFKKYPLNQVFKVVLFLPHIISTLALVVCYKYFVEEAVPAIWDLLFGVKIKGLLTNPNTEWPTIIIYSVWIGLGGSFLLYLGAISGISDSVFDAAQVDGVNSVQEFVFIVFPMIYPTFLMFVVTSFATLFTNQANIYSFYGDKAEYNVYTMGYLLYAKVRTAPMSDYPYYSSLGLILTGVAIPLCFGVRYLLNKLGPKTI